MCTKLSFGSKDFVLGLLKPNLVRESALLVPQVKLRSDDKSDRCGHVSSCYLGSIWSFRTSGSPTINTPPPPPFACGCSKFIPERNCREHPKNATEAKPKIQILKPKSH